MRQKREMNGMIRRNQFQIKRDIQDIQKKECVRNANIFPLILILSVYRADTIKLLRTIEKEAKQRPSERASKRKEAKLLAGSLIHARKTIARLQTNHAQLESVRLQMHEAIGQQKIQSSMKTSVGIMRNVNALVKIPELTATMRQLSEELTKAGVIEEMVGDMMPDAEYEEDDEETEAEVAQVLTQILGDKNIIQEGESQPLPEPVTAPVEELPSAPVEVEDPTARVQFLQGRLDALKS
jgi:charged multivesicular body protein 3